MAATPTRAFELFGIKIFERENEADPEDVIGEPQRYTVDFIVEGDDEEIEEAYRRASDLWGDRDEPASGAAGLIAKARSDYRRLLLASYAVARYGPTISIRINGREAAELAPDAELPDPASVVVAIEPGPEFRFGETVISERAPPPIDEDDEVEAPEDVGFVTGEPARSTAIVTAARLSVEAWREQGRPKAELVEERIEAAHDENLVDVALTVEPGPRAVYGPVGVQGTERMDPEFVAFMTGLEPGQEYDPDDLERASERLRRLDVFRTARLEEAEAVGPDGSLPITVVVQERPLRRFGVGASYSTVDGAGVEAYWLHRNLFGRAERLRVEGRVAGIGASLDPEDFTYRLGASFLKPGILTPDTDFTASLFGDREVLDPYTRTGVNGEVGVTQIFNEDLSGRLLVQAGYNRFEEEAFDRERDFTHLGLLGGLVLDRRDDPANATEGYYLEATAEPFYEFEYGNPTLRLITEGRAYLGFGEDDPFVLAGRLRLGSILGPPLDEISPDKLFFAGGGGSVRGYAFRSIGLPVFEDGEDTGDVTGGRSLVEASVEARARVTETIGLVGFVDAGYVGENPFPEFDEDVKIGAGVGLRYLTGFGPIRLDVAVPLDPGEDDPDFAFYVGIGQAF
ncbi:MAG TPA: autotransporter assembly complex family protein [Mesorhizobium sp.]|nr:autotransporter assembly complex family protein [Mesorhizobium sp.]